MKKTAIMLALAFLSISLLNFAIAAPNCEEGVTELSNGICIPADSGLPDPDPDGGGIATIIVNVMQWLLGILGAIAIIGFVISGMQYLLSAGDDKRMETAKRNMTYCIIGVVVGISGYVIILAIDAALRGNAF